LHLLPDELVLRQLALDVVGVGEICGEADAVRHDDVFELLVRLRIADDAQEGREARARAE
jgi:hypothetical protein